MPLSADREGARMTVRRKRWGFVVGCIGYYESYALIFKGTNIYMYSIGCKMYVYDKLGLL